jgi:hypothetical protein
MGETLGADNGSCMRYDLFRYSEPEGQIGYAFVADDERKQDMLDVQAQGATAEWIWSYEADTAEKAIEALNKLMEETDWHP